MTNKSQAKTGRRSHRTDPILKLKSIFFASIQSKTMHIFCVVLCIFLAMTTGILTIYFTAPRPSTDCERTFKRTMKSSLIFESQPRSVVANDLDHDHQIDFVVANSGTDNIGVFISQGNGTFANQRTYPTGSGSHPRSLAISDFDNDTYSDIVVANYDTNNIGLFLGYGNGTFKDQKVIPLGSSHPIFVTTGDFNKDNRMDIVVVNNGTNTISILLGYGNGSFQQQTTYFTGYDSLPCSAAVGDFNNDTYLDIVVTNSGTNNIGIFLNYGNGTFTNQEIYTTTLNSKPSSAALGDLNNDTILDIAVANYGSGSVGIFFGHGNGTFLPQVLHRIGVNASLQYVTVDDMNKDKALDLIVVDSQHDRIHVLPGYGNGKFAMVATYDGISGSRPVWITVGDFNNNNQSDIVVVNHDDNNVVVLMDYSAKPSVRQVNYHVAESSLVHSVAVSDINNDGTLDIVFNAGNCIGTLIASKNFTFDGPKTYPIDGKPFAKHLCTGDINNDNRMDVITSDLGLDGIDVFLGYGNGSFDRMTYYSTGIGSDPWCIVLADLNEDDVLDIVSANSGTYSIGILIGNGDGSFVLTRNYSIDGIPRSIAVDDIDNNNHSDIVVCNHDGSIVVYLGQGDGTFHNLNTYLRGDRYHSWSITLANLNRDNYLDIVATNFYRDSVSILLGYGNGTFAIQTDYPTGLGSGSVPFYTITADFNDDTMSDIAVTAFGSDQVVIYYGYGNGSFASARNYSTGLGSKPYSIATADLDNDTHLEFVVALWGSGDIGILTEYNAADFQSKLIYSTGAVSQPTSVALGDFNNDNRSDIVVANSGRGNLSILFALSNDTFDMEMMYPIGTDSSPQYVITHDINKDNHIDIVSANSKSNSISLIMGYGNGTFSEQMIYETGNNSLPCAVVVGDVNNDNRLDLVVANSGTDSIGILYAYDYSSFQTSQTYLSNDSLEPGTIVVSDFNNDNILDLAVTFFTSDSWCILLGYENGSFTNLKTYSLPYGSGPWGIGVGDFNNDNQSDIVITNFKSGNIGVVLGYGNGSFGTITLYSTGNESKPIAVAVGDFNNDNRLDITVVNTNYDNIGVFLGHGNGSFTTMMTYSTGQRSLPYAVTVADFNNDDRLDIAVVNVNTNNIGIFVGYENGTFADQVLYSAGYNSGPRWITINDFNGDKQLDIATANYGSNNVGILLGNGNGSFASVKTYSTSYGSLPRFLSVGDFNNDNISDIGVANYGSDSIVILFGLGDGSFLLGKSYSTGSKSSPGALVNGDFNQDGRLDIAVINEQSNTIGIFLGQDTQLFAGLTTYSLDKGSKPHSIALGDFNNDSLVDIVVVNYGTDSVEILFRHDGTYSNASRIYSSGSGSAPYSVAVSDFNNDTHLDMVISNSGTDNIVILLNDGTGKFTNRQTYSTGTRSRPYTVAIDDFNNDNIFDIAVTNSGTSNILLLYGYGNGTFGNDIFYHFGFGYQPYSIAVGDLNGDEWKDIAIACYGTDHVETLIKMC